MKKLRKTYFQFIIRIFMEILLAFQKSNIFAESCLTVCKSQNINAV